MTADSQAEREAADAAFERQVAPSFEGREYTLARAWFRAGYAAGRGELEDVPRGVDVIRINALEGALRELLECGIFDCEGTYPQQPICPHETAARALLPSEGAE